MEHIFEKPRFIPWTKKEREKLVEEIKTYKEQDISKLMVISFTLNEHVKEKMWQNSFNTEEKAYLSKQGYNGHIYGTFEEIKEKTLGLIKKMDTV